MKKVLVFIMFMTAMMSLTSCGTLYTSEDARNDYRTIRDRAWDRTLDYYGIQR